MSERFAAIDVGTNSVLLLVAERGADGRFVAVDEDMEITRLGEGVDRTRRLTERAVAETVEAVRAFAGRARSLGAKEIAVVTTSAARDAENGAEFLRRLRDEAGVEVEILSGEKEATFTYASAAADFGPGSLWAIDIGGGSTEVIGGAGGLIRFCRSFDVGAVRLTERCIASDPPTPEELGCVERAVREALSALEAPEPETELVGIAGTVTTLCAIWLGLDAYDGRRVHGRRMPIAAVEELERKLARMTLDERLRLPGLPPRRADVIVAGATILRVAMQVLGFSDVIVSDKGVRWGLLEARFGRGTQS